MSWACVSSCAWRGETALGCACGCVLLLPAGLSLLQNPRTIDPFSGYGYLFYGKSQQYGAIFYSTLLMPDAPYFKDLFQEGILKHTSLTAYLPLVGVAGGLAFCRARERHPFTYVLKVCVACAFVPVLNSAFYALNSSYYARWYYMPILVLCGATCYLLSRPALAEQRLPRALRLTTFLTLTAVVFAVVPGKDDDGNTVFGVLDEPARFWAIFGMTMLGIVTFALLWHFCRRKRRWGTILTAAVLGFSLLYGSLHLSLTKYAQWDVDSNLIAETYDSVEDVAAALPDDAFYRIDAYGAHNNLGLWFNRSCLQFFNSTVAPSIMAFYPEVGVKRDVNSKPDAENYALRGLLSVRYTLVAKDKETEWTDKDLPGWQRTGETDAYALYENENWVPMGFTYDCYVTADQLERVSEEERAQILCRAILLDDDQISAFGSLLEPLPDEELTDRGEDAYAADCAARRAAGVAAFTATDTGFTAKTAYDADELVFFSVPYDDGFSATVNGEPAAIEKVDDGLMAVYVPAGGERDRIYLPYARIEGVRLRERSGDCGVWGVFAGDYKETKKASREVSGNICREGSRPLPANLLEKDAICAGEARGESLPHQGRWPRSRPEGFSPLTGSIAKPRAGHARPLRTAVNRCAREGQGGAAAHPLPSWRVVDREWAATQGPSESPQSPNGDSPSGLAPLSLRDISPRSGESPLTRGPLPHPLRGFGEHPSLRWRKGRGR